MHSILYKLIVITGIFSFVKCCSIVPGTSYYIQNSGDELCVSTEGNGNGTTATNVEGTIHVLGNLSSKPCEKRPEQEWTFKRAKFSLSNGTKCIFHITSSLIHNYHIQNNHLNVNVSGNFMDYWNSTVQVVQNSTMKDTSSGKCFESQGAIHAPSFETCITNRQEQLWKFKVVNDPNHMAQQI